MCGRFAMNKETDELIQEFVARGGNAQDWTPAYSVAPTNSAPIIREWQPSDEDAPVREVELARWDFKPGAGTSPSSVEFGARWRCSVIARCRAPELPSSCIPSDTRHSLQYRGIELRTRVMRTSDTGKKWRGSSDARWRPRGSRAMAAGTVFRKPIGYRLRALTGR